MLIFSSLSFPSYNKCLPWTRAQITGHNGSVGVHFRSSALSFRAWLWDGHQREKICPNVDKPLTSRKLSLGKQNKSPEACVTQGFPRCQGLKDTRWPSATPPPEPFLSSHLSLKFLAFTCQRHPSVSSSYHQMKFFFLGFFKIFIYLAAPVLSCSKQGL